MNAASRSWQRLANLLHAFARPEYWFRPQQYWIRWRQRGHTAEQAVVVLPWGLRLSLHPREFMHSQVWLHGIYDLRVTETLWRLLDTGELAIDAGANIGYMTSIMAVRVGHTGRVIACEPLPENWAQLNQNVQRWQQENGVNNLVIHELALADHSGCARFKAPIDSGNLGLGALVDPLAQAATASQVQAPNEIEVRVGQLDNLVGTESTVGLLKIDVEGHELQVLHGAKELLAAGRIRDIVFEEHRPYPTPVTDFLESFGYRVYSLVGHFHGLSLCAAGTACGVGALDEPSLLATRDSTRAETRFRKGGWRALSNQRRIES